MLWIFEIENAKQESSASENEILKAGKNYHSNL